MTPQEFEYIKRAVAALESGDCTEMSQVKILKTVSQITKSAADRIEYRFVERVEQNMANNFLVDTLKS